MQRLLTEIRHMLLAFQIMSRIPINIALPCQPDDMIGSMVYFPLVGAVVGALMAHEYVQRLIIALLKHHAFGSAHRVLGTARGFDYVAVQYLA